MKYRPLQNALLMGAVFVLSGCMQHQSIAPEQRPPQWGKLIDAKHNLYQISDFVFRSEQPLQAQSTQLQTLGIDSIISLRGRNQTAEEFQNSDFTLMHIPINTWAMNRQDVLAVMQQLKLAQQKQQKVLIHCYHGSDRTGTMIAMYRILFEQWSIENAVTEMKYGGYGFHPIWVNIDYLFSEENISWLRQQLAMPATLASN